MGVSVSDLHGSTSRGDEGCTGRGDRGVRHSTLHGWTSHLSHPGAELLHFLSTAVGRQTPAGVTACHPVREGPSPGERRSGTGPGRHVPPLTARRDTHPHPDLARSVRHRQGIEAQHHRPQPRHETAGAQALTEGTLQRHPLRQSDTHARREERPGAPIPWLTHSNIRYANDRTSP